MAAGGASYNVQLLESPFNGYINRFMFTRKTVSTDLLSFLEDCFNVLKHILSLKLSEFTGLKFWLCAATTFHKSTNLAETIPGHFPNLPRTILHESDIVPALEESMTLIMGIVDKFEEKGSSWVLSSVESLDLFVGKYEPLRASSYVKLPRYLRKKHAIVNPKNKDQKCFIWSVLAALHPGRKHPERIAHYSEHVSQLDTGSVSFPTKIDEIDDFCRDNNVSINVYGFEKHLHPLRLSKQKTDRHINLLYYKGHYCWIKSFDRLAGDQNKHKSRGYYCETCLFPFYDPDRLTQHREHCGGDNPSRIQMPSEADNILKFTNHHRSLRKPTVVYGDFEVFLVKQDVDLSACDDNVSYTLKYQKHEPCSVGYVVSKSCCGDPRFENLTINTCDNPAGFFIEKLVEIAENNAHDNSAPLQMSQADEQQFLNSTECGLCKKPLVDDRVRDHCHVGRYRDALHSACNQKLRLDRDITVVLHNLRRYDSHIIMREIGNACETVGMELKVIARAMEDYTTFYLQPKGRNRSAWRIRFIDRVQFLSASLEKLVDTLSDEQFVSMNQHFDDKAMKLLTRKGVFPYDYLDSPAKLSDTEPISQSQFYNKLTETDISDDDYQHYLTVWKEMGIKTFQDYLELYLATDVLLLADVFEAFRKFAIDKYGLDPCHYSTLPGFAWDACLKMTGVELELLTDPDMYIFMESGIRGGMAYIPKRYAKAGEPGVNGKWAFIIYFDGEFVVVNSL